MEQIDYIQILPFSKLRVMKQCLRDMLKEGRRLLFYLENLGSKPCVLDNELTKDIQSVCSIQQQEVSTLEKALFTWRERYNQTPFSETLNDFESMIYRVKSIYNWIFFLLKFFGNHNCDKELSQLSVQLPLTDKTSPQGFAKPLFITPSKYIQCETCGEFVGHLVYIEKTSWSDIKNSIYFARSLIVQTNLPTWIIGAPVEIRDGVALAYVMKIWPNEEGPEIMLSSALNEIVEKLAERHCLI